MDRLQQTHELDFIDFDDEQLAEIDVSEEARKLELLTPANIEDIAEESRKDQNARFEVTTVVKKVRPKIKEQFVMMFIDNMRTLADLGLSSRQMKILLYIIEKMQYGNLFILSQKQMSEDLNIDKSDVSRDMRALFKQGAIIEKEGHRYLNSNIFSKGLKGSMDEERSKNLANAQNDSGGIYKQAF